jgi:hypothetical protein
MAIDHPREISMEMEKLMQQSLDRVTGFGSF